LGAPITYEVGHFAQLYFFKQSKSVSELGVAATDFERVVAEDVEMEEQAALLRRLDCDQSQGYLFSRPVPPQQVPELLRQQNQKAKVEPEGNGSATTKRNRVMVKSVKRR
jgi:predicted signal transduction protein with EAL and GGDEF domain